MKSILKATSLLAALVISATSALAHSGVELGPNGGRILEFSKNESLHGEVTAKDGKFYIALLDKDMKPVALADQVLTATSGDRNKPVKLEVTKSGNQFVVPMQKGDDYWVIFQFKPTAKGKAITARLHYDNSNCDACDSPEWLCKCKPEGAAGKK